MFCDPPLGVHHHLNFHYFTLRTYEIVVPKLSALSGPHLFGRHIESSHVQHMESTPDILSP